MQILDEMGIPYTKRQAVQLKKSDYEKYDLFALMDDRNMRNIKRIIPLDPEKKIHKLLDFAYGGDVADPWYTGDFEATYRDVVEGCQHLIRSL